jgi:hypothetical protein
MTGLEFCPTLVFRGELIERRLSRDGYPGPLFEG